MKISLIGKIPTRDGQIISERTQIREKEVVGAKNKN